MSSLDNDDDENSSFNSHTMPEAVVAAAAAAAAAAAVAAAEDHQVVDETQDRTLHQVIIDAVSRLSEACVDTAELVPDVAELVQDAKQFQPNTPKTFLYNGQTIIIPKDITHLVVMEGVTEIPDQQFSYCALLEHVQFPSSGCLRKIGKQAFCGCVSLLTLMLPDSLQEIGHEAFAFTVYLDTVQFPLSSSLKIIGSKAFYGCERLTTVKNIDSVEHIGKDAFAKSPCIQKKALFPSVDTDAITPSLQGIIAGQPYLESASGSSSNKDGTSDGDSSHSGSDSNDGDSSHYSAYDKMEREVKTLEYHSQKAFTAEDADEADRIEEKLEIKRQMLNCRKTALDLLNRSKDGDISYHTVYDKMEKEVDTLESQKTLTAEDANCRKTALGLLKRSYLSTSSSHRSLIIETQSPATPSTIESSQSTQRSSIIEAQSSRTPNAIESFSSKQQDQPKLPAGENNAGNNLSALDHETKIIVTPAAKAATSFDKSSDSLSKQEEPIVTTYVCDKSSDSLSKQEEPIATTNVRKGCLLKILGAVTVLSLIAALIVIFLGKPNELESQLDTTKESTTVSPTSAPSNTVPIFGFTNSPTEIIVYDPPTLEECLEISNGRNPENDSIARNFTLNLEVKLYFQVGDFDALLPALEEKMQEYLAPTLAGCSGISNRSLVRKGRQRSTNNDYYSISHAQFEIALPSNPITCDFDADICFLVNADLALFLKQKETVESLIDKISNVFQVNLVDKMDLAAPFEKVELVDVFLMDLTKTPSEFPSTEPTRAASTVPSSASSHAPSERASSIPPTMLPSIIPSASFTSTHPTNKASLAPTVDPSSQPTVFPTTRLVTATPTFTSALVGATVSPTIQPTRFPTTKPSSSPTIYPSLPPSSVPSPSPTNTPALKSPFPSFSPTTRSVTATPTFFSALVGVTESPSSLPTTSPTTNPSSSPTTHPSLLPSNDPSPSPTTTPTSKPTTQPSLFPSARPTRAPTFFPSSDPTLDPTAQPSAFPSSNPTFKPSVSPSSKPTFQPSAFPSSIPSFQPTKSRIDLLENIIVPVSLDAAFNENVTTCQRTALEWLANDVPNTDPENVPEYELIQRYAIVVSAICTGENMNPNSMDTCNLVGVHNCVLGSVTAYKASKYY